MFDFNESQRQARDRLNRESPRQRRSDAGKSRLPRILADELRSLLLGMDGPSITKVQRHLAEVAIEHGLRPPSRATLYKALPTIEGHDYEIDRLPVPVAAALYNLGPEGPVPGHQLAFYCFNYGSLEALSFASGLPWIDLYRASLHRGWRPRSRGLIEAALRMRR